MSPFREPPAVELGPLEVGLGRAARRAMMGTLPSGGRLIAPEVYARALRGVDHPPQRRSYTDGALGSLGLLLVSAFAFVVSTSGWEPEIAERTTFALAIVIAGGLSLAAVLRALDAPRDRPTLRGDIVGRAARRALRRARRLARQASRTPDRFGARRVAALRRTLAMLADPLIADWIPADVRGRTELLLARAIAASAGAGWSRDARIRREVASLLVTAAAHLADPSPARSDLSILTDVERSAGDAQEPRRSGAPTPSGSRRRPPAATALQRRFSASDAHDAESEEAEASGADARRATLRR